MSSPRPHARPRPRRPRLWLDRLDERAVPATFVCQVDPQANMTAAVTEINNYLDQTIFSVGADTIQLFPGGTYVLGQGTGAGGSLNTVLPYSYKSDFSAFEKTTSTLLTIDGRGATFTKAADDKVERLMTIHGDANGYGQVVVQDLNFVNGRSTDTTFGGGAVLVDGAPVTFNRVRFSGNSATERGGAVSTSATAAENWTNTFNQCEFTGNKSDKGGGAVATDGGDDKISYTFSDCQFTGNTAGLNGGGLTVVDSAYVIQRSSFYQNTAGASGGAVSATLGGGRKGLIVNSTFDSNAAATNGGALNIFGTTTGSVVAAYDTITRNTTGAAGGGVYGELGENIRLNQNIIATNKVGKTLNDLSGAFTGDGNGSGSDFQNLNWLGVGSGFTTYTFGSTTKTTISFLAGGDPVLGEMQHNGGPTLTRAPQSKSPFEVLNDGANLAYPDVLAATPDTDQRGVGFSRPFFSGGLGAYVVQQPGSDVLVLESGNKQVTATDAQFPLPLTVTLRDEYGQPVTDQPTQVRFQVLTSGAYTTYPLGRSVTINPGATAASPGTGSAVVYAAANPAEGVITITALTDSTPAANITLYSRAPLGTASITAPASTSAVVGSAYPPISVTVKDRTGAVVPNADVYFTVVLPQSGNGQNDPTAVPAVSASGTFTTGSGATQTAGVAAVYGQLIKATTDANGVATVTFTAGTKSGSVTLLATAVAADANGAPLVLASDTLTLTNTPGAAVELVKPPPDDSGNDTSGNNQTVQVGGATVAGLVVIARDGFRNPVSGVTVTLTNLDPTRAAGLANPGVTAVTDGLGRATFSTATGNPAVANGKADATPYTVRASSGTLTSDFQLTNIPGLPAAVVVVSGGGQSAPATDPVVAVGSSNQFADPLVVRVVDAGGNPVANALVGFSGDGVRFAANRVPTDANGLASTVAGPTDLAGTFTVTAQADTGTAGSLTETVTPVAPATLVVLSGSGQTAQAGTAFAQPIRVKVQDRFQNPVPGVTPTATAAGATVTATPTDANGVSTITVVAGGAAGAVTGIVTAGGLTTAFSLNVTGVPVDLTNPPPITGLPTLTATGLDAGVASRVTVYNPDGSVRTQFAPFDPGFLGGSRVAVARGPLGSQVVVVPGPGRFPDAEVFSADDGSPVKSFQPFEQTFTGGLFVAAADIDRDGYEDYVFSADVGGGPRVQIRSGRTGAVLQDFYGIDDPNFRGGARVAVGDVNGDGTPDLIVSAGVGGGPRIAVYDGKSLIGNRAVPVKLVGDFYAFEPTLRNGAYVAAGDVTGDGAADLVLGGGPGGGPRVRVLNGAELAQGRQTVVSDFYAGPSTDRGGIKVAVRNLDGDSKGDIVTASGAGDGSRVSVYLGKDLRAGQPLAARGFDDLSGFTGGVFVG